VQDIAEELVVSFHTLCQGVYCFDPQTLNMPARVQPNLLDGAVFVLEELGHGDVLEGAADDVDRAEELAPTRQVLHAVADVGSRHGRCRRGDARNVGPGRGRAKPSTNQGQVEHAVLAIHTCVTNTLCE